MAGNLLWNDSSGNASFASDACPITVSVEGADGFTAIDYDVWYVANASAASGTATLNITKN